jgi:AAA+ ATPase superfamily predicted ATPase
LSINPFTFGNPIRDPARFYGRKEELRQIVNRLRSSAHESTSVVGERRIGKTSLLKHLTDSQVSQDLGLTQDKFCLIYLDFQGLTDITPARFWQRVLQRIEKSICFPNLVSEIQTIRKMGDFDLFDLEDLFEIISSEGVTIVLLLDEFEYVTRNTNFGPDFFGGLRALAIHQNLPIVTATRRELVELCHSEEIKGSPFFNIFANIVLKPFSREEVIELLTGYLVETAIEFSPAEKELVILLGGGYPFFTQIAASYTWEARKKGFRDQDLLKIVTENFESQVDAHFNYMWSRSSESEKITLLAVLSLDRQKPSQKNLPTMDHVAELHPRAHLDIPELVKRGLLLENHTQATYRLLSPSLENWIAKEISAEPGEEESAETVQAWLQSGGRENLEPIGGILPKFKMKYWPVVSGIALDLSLELIGAVTWEILTKGVI